MKYILRILLAISLGCLLAAAGITTTNWLCYAILLNVGAMLFLHRSDTEIPDYLHQSLTDWTGAEPSQSRLARDVDRWLKE